MQEPSHEFDVFRHLNVELTREYRLVLRAFNDARERFALHLKPSDVHQFIKTNSTGNEQVDDNVLIQMLQKLVDWGNLAAHADSSEVRTVEDFNKPRFLYQLSRAGEAAELALRFFQQHIEVPGELQATALADILAELNALQLLLESELDYAKIYRTFRELFTRFEELTSRAQQFIGSIQRVIDLQGADVTTFLQYKETLLDYLERFIRELIVKGAQISVLLQAVPADRLDLALSAASERDLADALDKSPAAVARSRAQWQRRWDGLNHWFIGVGGPSQAEQLRARARSAIPDLLAVISSLNDRRAARSDRTADYRALARWFATASTPEEAHMLWRAAFCLTPARHLATTTETAPESLVTPKTSWMNAEPLWISPRLRSTGYVRKPGRTPAIVDRTEEKRNILIQQEEEDRQIEAARKLIVGRGAHRLSDFATLHGTEFALLLECLGNALCLQAPGDNCVETASRDGSLRVCLERMSDGSQARLITSDGEFIGPDYFISITEATGG